MLVLTRKVGEKILIGEDIIVHVIDVNRGNIRIGIEAPGRISILRFEVYERIREENLKAAKPESAEQIILAAGIWRKNK